MSLDTLETNQSLRDCEFTEEQAKLLARLLVDRDEDLVKQEELDRRLLESDHKTDNLQRDVEQLRVDMENGFTQTQEAMERGFAQLHVDMERSFEQARADTLRDLEQLRLEMKRDLDLSQAEQRRHTEQVASEAAQRSDRIERNTLLAIMLAAGLIIAAVGLIVALI